MARRFWLMKSDPDTFGWSDLENVPKRTTTWDAVQIRLDRKFKSPVDLETLRTTPGLEGMLLLRRGMRLSVMPVTKEEWAIVTRLGGK